MKQVTAELKKGDINGLSGNEVSNYIPRKPIQWPSNFGYMYNGPS